MSIIRITRQVVEDARKAREAALKKDPDFRAFEEELEKGEEEAMQQWEKEQSVTAATFELYKDRAGEYRWRLRHKNGQIIADSGEGYTTKANAVNGIESVKENAVGAPVEDQSA